MRSFSLINHSGAKDINIDAFINVDDSVLTVGYRVSGSEFKDILFSSEESGVRKWNLWEHTCFELFIKHVDKPWYLEFNFSSAKDWNIFYLSDFRKNDGEFGDFCSMVIETQKQDDSFELEAKIPFDQLKKFRKIDFDKNSVQVGITTVIERRNGNLEYWALKQRDGMPDFHDKSTFTLY